MIRSPFAALFLAGSLLAGCGQFDPVARSAPTAPVMVPGSIQPRLHVVDVRVEVPRHLTVSEANSYFPRADIVWRGDPPGDRHAQVAALIEEGLERGAAAHDAGYPVVVDIEVTRFHSVTEKARYTVGGNHAIAYVQTVRDAATGVPIIPPREIRADLAGFGGRKALEAEATGQGMKQRISDHLAGVMAAELAWPVIPAGAPGQVAARF